MPRFTESRINWLCEQAKAAATEEELEVVIQELRAALQEHIRLAKESLSAQANAVHALESVAKKARAKTHEGSPGRKFTPKKKP